MAARLLAWAFVLAATATAQAHASPSLRLVVVVGSAGVHSPDSYSALAAYSARPWPKWNVPAGSLTPHGALLETFLGAYYRAFYSRAGLLDASGCAFSNRTAVLSDERPTDQATADALLAGLAPGCALARYPATSAPAPLLDSSAAVGKADPSRAVAALRDTAGGSSDAITESYRPTFARLDALLDCASSDCRRVATLPGSIAVAPASGLAFLRGPVDIGASATEELLMEYAGALPGNQVGWGRLDLATLIDLSQLRVLRQRLEDRNPYAARVSASNLAAHLLTTLSRTDGRRFIAFVCRDSKLAQLAGLLHLSWEMPGYQPDDTPPGSGLIFELHDADRTAGQKTPFVQVFFVAQPLDAMRRATAASSVVPVLRVPVTIPGCSASCPLDSFDSILKAAIDPAFVSATASAL